jgi:hypothetical protein
MARVGEEFPFACPGCGGDIRLIAFITEPQEPGKHQTKGGNTKRDPAVSGQFYRAGATRLKCRNFAVLPRDRHINEAVIENAVE